ncbi:nickel pincer cofactor biosynthesis protein LarB [Alienimonas californiensis]|uniref:nickel pincer cofactor biosynthesis protein LarB n=1 Tax=Alienimonas californiensis TaxID=2527989 RepID=UPI0011A82084|nr:nickel pincer cofactor biosynthesis protein LarB [Alienimonas californiensis]
MPSPTARTPDASVDLDRAARCGYPEVAFGEGKTGEQIAAVFAAQREAGQRCFATRVSDEARATLAARFPSAVVNDAARTVRLGEAGGEVGFVPVVTAGTTDRPVAEEALETLRWMGVRTALIADVGVAGPHRLPERLPELAGADAAVVVAGMEGALPSVVGGHLPCPVVAVPTSVGYGANFGGLAALLGMLNSCAANVVAVNIDAGFKGGYVAGLIARGPTFPTE